MRQYALFWLQSKFAPTAGLRYQIICFHLLVPAGQAILGNEQQRFTKNVNFFELPFVVTFKIVWVYKSRYQHAFLPERNEDNVHGDKTRYLRARFCALYFLFFCLFYVLLCHNPERFYRLREGKKTCREFKVPNQCTWPGVKFLTKL